MSDVTAQELASDEDALRLRRAQDVRSGLRPYERCRNCRKKIPETKRRDARYCSYRCGYRYRNWDGLRAEVERAIRLAACAGRTCPECRATYDAHRVDQVYCSQACGRRSRWRERYRQQPRYNAQLRLDPTSCEGCGESFRPFRANHKFCSRLCRRRAWELRTNAKHKKRAAYQAQRRPRGRSCVVCGASIDHRRTDAKVCSKACRHKVQWQQQLERRRRQT